MFLANIANSKYNLRFLEGIMKHNQLVERSRQSFTRLARFINQLMRAQLFCGPVTVQQCYTLEALIDGPKTMSALAAEVALHQSTLTRIVEKLEKQDLLIRRRRENNQRTVEVRITDAGKQVHALLEAQSSQMISELLDLIPQSRQIAVVEAMEELANLLAPENEAFQQLLKGCRCKISHGEGTK
ncbi:MAG: MarR family transcriptional regulator [Desulfobacterales bacterium]|jgi:DNA-binding MarR family transcriptional regulator